MVMLSILFYNVVPVVQVLICPQAPRFLTVQFTQLFYLVHKRLPTTRRTRTSPIFLGSNGTSLLPFQNLVLI
jgi:hypothetical protein